MIGRYFWNIEEKSVYLQHHQNKLKLCQEKQPWYSV